MRNMSQKRNEEVNFEATTTTLKTIRCLQACSNKQFARELKRLEAKKNNNSAKLFFSSQTDPSHILTHFLKTNTAFTASGEGVGGEIRKTFFKVLHMLSIS